MIRSAVAILCVVCVATLVTEVLGLGLLWYRGQLTAETVREIRAVISGQQLSEPAAAEEEEASPAAVSGSDVVEARVARLFEITTREDELAMFKSMLLEKSDALAERQRQFEQQRREFDARLTTLEDAAVAEATERSRAVLLALPEEEAVVSLMVLPLEEDVRLLTGMPEKSIAKILEEFLKGDEEQKARGREIFEAITRGDPMRQLIETAGSPAGPADTQAGPTP